MVVSLFCTTDNGILIQDSFSRPASCESLLALEIPFYYFKKKVGAYLVPIVFLIYKAPLTVGTTQ